MGMSQEQLAFECNLSVPYISMVENGKKSISLHALLQIADVMECTLDWIIYGEEGKTTGLVISVPLMNMSDEERQELQELLSKSMKMLIEKGQ